MKICLILHFFSIVSVTLSLLNPLSIYAYDFESNGIYYNKISNSEVAVTYSGETPNKSIGYDCELVIPETVEFEGSTHTVTVIEDNGMDNTGNLKSIVIPNTVDSIGYYAFYDRYRLTSITYTQGVTKIESNTFRSCDALTSINIPKSVTFIGDE